VAVKRTSFDVFELKWFRKEPVVWLTHIVGVRSDVSLPLYMHAAVFATSQWLHRWCPEDYGPKCHWASLLQLINVVFQFLCNVR